MIRMLALCGLTIAAALGTAAPARADEVLSGDAVVMTLGSRGTGKVASGVELTVVHVDNGPHSLGLDLEGLVSLSMTSTRRDLALVATFAGAKTFHARITRGDTTKTLSHITHDILLPDFDLVHAGAREATTFRVVQGLERLDAFSVVIEHDDQRIVLTPDGASPSSTLPANVVLSSTGLEGFTLAGTRFAWMPSLAVVATTMR